MKPPETVNRRPAPLPANLTARDLPFRFKYENGREYVLQGTKAGNVLLVAAER